MTAPRTDRRTLLALTAAAAAFPGASLAQGGAVLPAAMNRLAALAGVNPLPQDLLRGLADALPEDLRALEQVDRGEALPEEVRIRLLEALWTGVTPGDDAARIGFSSALMWAAIEESNNVLSYCGGVPGFWAEPPETA